jgi:hypothetical protein
MSIWPSLIRRVYRAWYQPVGDCRLNIKHEQEKNQCESW